MTFRTCIFESQFQENGCCIFDSSATMPCAPESFEGGLVCWFSTQVTPWWGLNEIALNVLRGQHPNSYQSTLYAIPKAKPYGSHDIYQKTSSNTSSNTIYLNSSSKFHVWNIWCSDPPQMREHLAVANEQAGEVPGSNESIGIKSWWRSKSNGWKWWPDLGTFFVTENGSLKWLLGTFVGKSSGIYHYILMSY